MARAPLPFRGPPESFCWPLSPLPTCLWAPFLPKDRVTSALLAANVARELAVNLTAAAAASAR